MTTVEIRPANLNELLTKFYDHFISNPRILFSGPFGSGKTTFLKYYFETDEIKKRNEAIFISPVLYSVASNDDIFELIKFDIITELLNKFPDYIDDIEIPAELVLSNMLSEKSEIVSTGIVDAISKIPAFPVLKLIKNLSESDSYKKTKEKLEKASEEQLKEFLRKSNVNRYRWADTIEFIISEVIERIKKKLKKNVVLVIDDLDRLDPAHVFRILNVFSVHFDTHAERDNRFNFDKVIIVGHDDNLASIFHHLYGKKTDYPGYIGKFYTGGAYKFTNADVAAHLRYVLGEIIEPESGMQKDMVKELYKELVVEFYLHGVLRLRTIREHPNLGLLPRANLKAGAGQFNMSTLIAFPIFVKLIELFGSTQNFINALLKIQESKRALRLKDETSTFLLKNTYLIYNLKRMLTAEQGDKLSYNPAAGDRSPVGVLTFNHTHKAWWIRFSPVESSTTDGQNIRIYAKNRIKVDLLINCTRKLKIFHVV